jgi:hypothetical protein
MALGTELYLAQKTIKLLREKIFRFSERMELIEELEKAIDLSDRIKEEIKSDMDRDIDIYDTDSTYGS